MPTVADVETIAKTLAHPGRQAPAPRRADQHPHPGAHADGARVAHPGRRLGPRTHHGGGRRGLRARPPRGQPGGPAAPAPGRRAAGGRQAEPHPEHDRAGGAQRGDHPRELRGAGAVGLPGPALGTQRLFPVRGAPRKEERVGQPLAPRGPRPRGRSTGRLGGRRAEDGGARRARLTRARCRLSPRGFKIAASVHMAMCLAGVERLAVPTTRRFRWQGPRATSYPLLVQGKEVGIDRAEAH